MAPLTGAIFYRHIAHPEARNRIRPIRLVLRVVFSADYATCTVAAHTSLPSAGRDRAWGLTETEE